ncbi:MAG: hypothetical protein HYS81_02775 [Candidatus Aenigmatarchaeota archaeon]|nr:MAG: hypothetical protein HYS81_02775 [Candidatus Aenigmarchaeota archaeon]
MVLNVKTVSLLRVYGTHRSRHFRTRSEKFGPKAEHAEKRSFSCTGKAQTGIEFMVVAGIVLVLASIILFSLNERNLNVEKARQQFAAQREVEKVSGAIDAAAIGGKGFQTNITVAARAGVQNATTFKVLGKYRKVEMTWPGPRNETLIISARLITAKVKDADLRTALVNVNNTGDNIEVKCWNADGTNVQTC